VLSFAAVGNGVADDSDIIECPLNSTSPRQPRMYCYAPFDVTLRPIKPHVSTILNMLFINISTKYIQKAKTYAISRANVGNMGDGMNRLIDIQCICNPLSTKERMYGIMRFVKFRISCIVNGIGGINE